MVEDRNITRPVGRPRRVIGLILVGLGAAIWARVGWLGAFYGSGFRHVEWVRFSVWLWLGALLVLAGFWLAYRSRVAAWATGLVVLALFVGAYIHDHWLR